VGQTGLGEVTGRTMSISASQSRYFDSAAYHEAGHMTAAVVQGMPIQVRGMHTDVLGNGIAHYWMRDQGDAKNNSPQDQRERKLSLVTLYAAWLAQRRFYPNCSDQRWRGDEVKVCGLLREIHPTDEAARSATDKDLRERTGRLVGTYYSVIEKLAQNLLAKPCKLLPPEELNGIPRWAEANYGHSMGGGEVVDFYKTFLPKANPRILVSTGSNYNPSKDTPLFDSLT